MRRILLLAAVVLASSVYFFGTASEVRFETRHLRIQSLPLRPSARLLSRDGRLHCYHRFRFALQGVAGVH